MGDKIQEKSFIEIKSSKSCLYPANTANRSSLYSKLILIILMTINIIDCFAHATLKIIYSPNVCRTTRGDTTNIYSVF